MWKNIQTLKNLASIILLTFITYAQGAVITVNAPNGAEINGDGLCSISEAILNANVDAATFIDCAAGNGADTIELTDNITLEAFYENDTTYGRTGTPAITSELILDGKGFSLQRNSDLNCDLNFVEEVGEFRILRSTVTANLTLQNITIANGCSDAFGPIFNKRSGGGLYSQGDLSITNTVFKLNKSRDAGAGIAHFSGTISSIEYSQFIDNNTYNLGGGIYSVSTITTIIDSTFSDNSAASGGAIYNWSSIDTIINSVFSGNSTTSGGAIYNSSGTITEILNSTFSRNSAIFIGGAIYNNSAAIITKISNSTFSGNSASSRGGAIYNYEATITNIFNVTFSGNSASDGSAIYNNQDFGTAEITNLNNSLFHNNSGIECIKNNGGTFNGTNNLSNNATSGCPSVSTNLTTSSVGSLANNGGATMTHALYSGSQAIDAAINGTTTDQRGFSIDGSNRDIGAFEVQDNELCINGLESDGFTTDVSNTIELRKAIRCSNTNGANLDTINLTADITLPNLFENNLTYGRTGTPAIATALTLNGNGFAVSRDANLACIKDKIPNATEFRVLRTASGADLSLQSITIANGCIDGTTNFSERAGGLMVAVGATVSIMDTTFNNNYASKFGGAIFNAQNITSIDSSLFANNSVHSSAGDGGAIYNTHVISTIQNSTFSGNSANTGGAIFNDINLITNILNSTFSSNTATNQGAAIFNTNASINNLNDSLFHNNNGTSECTHTGSGILNFTNNLTNNTSNVCSNITTLNTSTVGVLADNGGPTMTHALMAGSEAIDAGDNTATNSDQRGVATQGSARDIGAFEYFAQFNLDIQVTGLAATNSISFDNAGNGALTFNTNETQTISILDSGSYYDVTISSAQPDTPNQTCIFTNTNTGYLNGANTTITVDCTTTQYAIGGTVSGLVAAGLVLQNNAGDDLVINVDGAFTFTTTLIDLSSYAVTVLHEPAIPDHVCTVSNSNGNLSGTNITNVAVSCITTCRVVIGSGMVGSTDSFEACDNVITAPSLFVNTIGELSLSAGLGVTIGSGFTVEIGGILDVKTCGQSLCEMSNEPMIDGCHTCISDICAVDASCCTTAFTQACQDMVSSVCGLTCD